MKFEEVQLPSNRKFGFFFGFLFLAASSFFYINSSKNAMYAFALMSVIFLIITIFKSDLLLPLNVLWMRFGLVIGIVVSPLVLGMIFFGIFSPIALLMRLCGRDELRIKLLKRGTHWISRSDSFPKNSFKNQF